MELFRIKKDIQFMSYSRLTTGISLVTFILAIFFLCFRGLNLSVEFTGGTLMEVQYTQAANIDKIRDDLEQLGLEQASVQAFGSSKNVMLRLPNKANMNSSSLSNEVMTKLKIDNPDVQLKSAEFIGPQVGKDLVNNGLMAIAFVCIGIMLYLALRFELSWRICMMW